MQAVTNDPGTGAIYKHNYRREKSKMAGDWIQGAIKHKGAFTRQAQHAGMSDTEFADHVLSHEDDFSPKTVKRANLDKTLARMRAKKSEES